MSRTSILHRLWAALTKPREGGGLRILRQRSIRQRSAHGPQLLLTDRDYDRAIRDYLALWLDAGTDPDHYQAALLHFGLSRDDAEFVDQVLCSAALGTLPNWANCHDDPWWQAAWRYSQSLDRALLDRLRWEIERRL